MDKRYTYEIVEYPYADTPVEVQVISPGGSVVESYTNVTSAIQLVFALNKAVYADSYGWPTRGGNK